MALARKELKRRIKQRAKEEYGVKITYKQIETILLAFRDVSIEECLNGGSVEIPRFIKIFADETATKILPSGENNKPRLTIRARISTVCSLDFKSLVMNENEQYDYIEED